MGYLYSTNTVICSITGFLPAQLSFLAEAAKLHYDRFIKI